jgi:hypothetical protein
MLWAATTRCAAARLPMPPEYWTTCSVTAGLQRVAGAVGQLAVADVIDVEVVVEHRPAAAAGKPARWGRHPLWRRVTGGCGQEVGGVQVAGSPDWASSVARL